MTNYFLDKADLREVCFIKFNLLYLPVVKGVVSSDGTGEAKIILIIDDKTISDNKNFVLLKKKVFQKK